MNVYHINLVFICFVTAAKGNFQAVIFDWDFSISIPRIQPISDTEAEVGFDYSRNCLYASEYLYAACPLPGHERLEDYAFPEVLVPRKIANSEYRILLDQQPECELQPQVTFVLTVPAGQYRKYQIGYRMFHGELDDSGFIPYSRREKITLGLIYTLHFNRNTTNPVSVGYKLSSRSRFISTASNKKHTFVYEKNEKILEIDLDYLYHNFVHQILPRMVEEKSKNPLAHALGIQKMQLATPDDFPINTWKMATYWNINTVSIWRVLLLRWNAIEIYSRNVFKRGDIEIEMETGINGTFELAERYYENDTVPKLHIPKYVWKLLTLNDYFYRAAMLIIMHNDPFTENQQPLCEDICAINGWLVSNNDYRTGLVYCCEMTEKIAKILGYRDYNIYSFTKNRGGTEDLEGISRILCDLQKELYDW